MAYPSPSQLRDISFRNRTIDAVMTTPPGPLVTEAQADVQARQAHARKVREYLDKDSADNRKTLETFYLNLGLFSGGTFSLSLTYLGYLKSTAHAVIHTNILIMSWGCFVAAVPLSLFFSFLYASYVTYQRGYEYSKARSEQYTAEAKAVSLCGALNLSPEEVPEYVNNYLRQAKDFNDEAERCTRKGKVYFLLWRWGGLTARVLFIVGLALLFWFASSNALTNVAK